MKESTIGGNDVNQKSVILSPHATAAKPPTDDEQSTSIAPTSDITGPTLELSPRTDSISANSGKEFVRSKSRRIILIRNAEPMDRAFPDWLKRAFFTDEYRPYDLNHPLSLPRRAGAPYVFAADPPLTEMGNVVAQMIGRGLDSDRVLVVVSSPSLRCMETAKSISTEIAVVADFDDPLPICVEPGFFDFAGQYPALPCLMTTAEYSDEGYPISCFYKPIRNQSSCQHLEAETMKGCRNRCQEVMTQLLRRYPGAGDVVIVTHGVIIHWIIRGLVDMNIPNKTIDQVYPHGCVIVLEQETSGKEWTLRDSAIQPITFTGYQCGGLPKSNAPPPAAV